MRGPVVVRFQLDPGIVDLLDMASAWPRGGHGFGYATDGHLLGELVENPELSRLRWVLSCEAYAGDGVYQVDDTPRLAPRAVHRERRTEHGLYRKAV